MSVTIETDNGKVELQGAATEDTLNRLLKAMTGKSENNKAAVQQYGKAVTDAANATKKTMVNLKGLGKSADDTADELDRAARGASNFANRAKSMVTGLLNGVKGLVTFAGQTAGTGMNMSQLGNAVEGLGSNFGVIGGILGASGGAIVGHSANLIDTFDALSSTGANFTNNLFDLERTAANSYLSLEQMTGMLRSNSEALAVFGGSTRLGAKRFTEMNQVMQNTYRRDFAMLGLKASDSAEMLASFTAMQARNTAFQTMGTNQQAQAGANFVKEITMLANLTGQDRKQLAERMAQNKLRADIELQISRMGETGSKNTRAVMNMMNESFKDSPGVLDAFMANVTGMGVATTTFGNQLLTNPVFGPMLKQISDGVKDGSMTMADAQMILAQNAEAMINQGKQFEKIAPFSEFGTNMTNLNASLLPFLRQQQVVNEVADGNNKKFVKNQTANLDANSKALKDVQLLIQDVGKTIRLGFNSITESSVGLMREGVEKLKEKLDQLPTTLDELMKALGDASGPGATGGLIALRAAALKVVDVFNKFRGASATSGLASGASQAGNATKAGVEATKKSTSLMSKAGEYLGKAFKALPFVAAGATAIQSGMNSNRETLAGKTLEGGGSGLGSLGGGFAGLKVGAAIGTAIFPGIGTAIGGLIGSIGGAIVGEIAGKGVASDIANMFGFADGGIVTQPVFNAAIAEKPGSMEGVFPLDSNFKASDLNNLKDIPNIQSGMDKVATEINGLVKVLGNNYNAEMYQEMVKFNKNIQIVQRNLV